MINYTPVITDEIYKKLSLTLISKIKEEGNQWYPDITIGITRGGLPLATKLSHYLDIPMETWKVALRDNTRIDPCPVSNENDQKILIVEDINDLGQTLFTIDDILKTSGFNMKNVRYAVLIDNEFSLFKKVTYWGEKVKKGTEDPFIYFPWEKQPEG